MHLAETSLIKKYENNIGDSIVGIGGAINHDEHWLPYLADQIVAQLIDKSGLDEKIDEHLAELGVTPDSIDAWNQVVEDFKNGAVRYDIVQTLTEEQQRQARENIDIQTTYDAARWDNNE